MSTRAGIVARGPSLVRANTCAAKMTQRYLVEPVRASQNRVSYFAQSSMQTV